MKNFLKWLLAGIIVVLGFCWGCFVAVLRCIGVCFNDKNSD